jgi:hypothetical protein
MNHPIQKNRLTPKLARDDIDPMDHIADKWNALRDLPVYVAKRNTTGPPLSGAHSRQSSTTPTRSSRSSSTPPDRNKVLDLVPAEQSDKSIYMYLMTVA